MTLKGVRKHHNNKGLRRIKLGKLKKDAERIAKRLGVKPLDKSPKVW